MRQYGLIGFLLLVTVLLAACAGALRWSPESYTVKEGDTLYSIAFRHGLDYRELAEWNDIGQNYLIFPGDQLALSPHGSRQLASRDRGTSSPSGDASSKPASQRQTRDDDASSSGSRSRSSDQTVQPPQRRGDIQWRWPVEGELINAFGEGSMDKGIQIAADEGSDVKAAASGRVVYTGSGLIGYGKLIIIKHDDIYLSAYGHNQDILVEEGTSVDAGEVIASVGLGRGNRSMLHFEIRSEGQAVDPMSYLSR